MRYYAIIVTNAAGNVVKSWSSYVNGQSLPGALNVEMDLPIASYGTPSGNVYVRIWGVPLQDIAQASNLNGLNIVVYGGMQKGLPLANPRQAGLLAKGKIFQAFGNWIDVNQTLDIIFAPATGSPDAPANIALNWKAGLPLGSAIQAALGSVFSGYTINVNVSSQLVQNFSEWGNYQSLTQFAQYLRQRSRAIVNGGGIGSYQGVQIAVKDNTINVVDGSSTPAAKTIQFQDLVGQPTWYNPGQISVTCIMRADISPHDIVTLPNTLTTVQAAAAPGQNVYGNCFNSAFQGTFFVETLRHIGNFRQPQAEAWVTTLFCHPQPSQAATLPETVTPPGTTIVPGAIGNLNAAP